MKYQKISSYWRRSCSCRITIYCYNQTDDLRTNHKEADNILAHQMVVVASEENKGIAVISDDTDVFVLLLHHYVKRKLTGIVIMPQQLILDLLAAHE